MSGSLFFTILVIGAYSAFVIALAGGSIYTGLKPRSPMARQTKSERSMGHFDPPNAA